MKVFVTGGAGYVGAVLVPRLLKEGHEVTVLDLMIYGEEVLSQHENLVILKGDIRDKDLLEEAIPNHDSLIHLACISNDPSFELNPKLGKSINLDSFRPLVEISKKNGVSRFIFASSSSVYGVKEESSVTEDLKAEPLTDYSLFKLKCEEILLNEESKLKKTIIRPATVCGYSERQRLDVIVNILTNHAFFNNKIIIHGGDQLRPNIHIDDMADSYIKVIDNSSVANKEIFNVGDENHSVNKLAGMVNEACPKAELIREKVFDQRSYKI